MRDYGGSILGDFMLERRPPAPVVLPRWLSALVPVARVRPPDRVAAVPPADALAAKELADALLDQGRVPEAIDAYRRVLAVFPDFGRAWNNFGLALRQAGRTEEAANAFEYATRLSPELAAGWINHANCLEASGRLSEALACLQQLIGNDPGSSLARHNAGTLLARMGRFRAAEAHLRAGLDAHPDDADLSHSLGLALCRQGRIDESLAWLARVVEALPPPGAEPVGEVPDPAHASSYLMTLNYSDRAEPSFVAQEHRRVAQRLGLAQAVAAPAVSRATDQPLRVGYVSSDFGFHVVSFFMEPLLACHDRSRVLPFCYSNAVREDDQSRRLQGFGVQWRSIAHLDDAAALALMRADALDVCVDLSGHTAGHRLPLFARRVAPVQVTWLGYPNTTGVASVDVRLTDAVADPPGITEALHTERLVRLPGCFLAYGPRPEAPPVASLPALRRGHVTYGCFNNFAKVSDHALSLWVRLLDRVPGARLLLKSKGLDEEAQARAVRARFSTLGGDPARLDLRGEIPGLGAHLQAYDAVDVALDTVPYAGTTTTCEALWMGVPVVTLAGACHAARVGASLLTAAGRPQWIAVADDGYVALAADLAGDLTTLAAERARLRQAVGASTLVDVARFARTLEDTLLTLVGAPRGGA